jgi:SAM-dependent methyltransferase
VPDFNTLLHDLRSRELARVPGGARVVLSGGCAGSWYFEWFADNYPTPVERHLGIELHADRPEDLPDEVEWLDRSLGDLAPVVDGEVDLVFAGQVLEHLWSDEVAGFLLEAHRVLRPGRRLVLDSPNRRVTSALGWTQPEHTVEFTVGEARELLTLAGFDQIEIRGIWLCWDDETGRPLPLDPDPADDRWTFERRRDEAESRPEDSFVWWAEAERSQAKPDAEALHRRVQEIFARERPRYLNRLRNEIGVVSERGNGRVVATAVGEAGYLVRGPGIAMPAGEWRASFALGLDPTGGGRVRPTDVLGSIEVATARDGAIAVRHLTVEDVGPDGTLRALALPFSLDGTAYGTEFRVRSTGRSGLRAQLHVALEEGEEEPAEVEAEEAEDDDVDVGRPEDAVHQPAATASPPAPAPPPSPPANTSQGQGIGRRIGRALLWPLRRFFDPRFEGLAQHITVTREDHAQLAQRLDVARAEVVEAVEAGADRRHAATAAEFRSAHAELRSAHAELRSALAESRSAIAELRSVLSELQSALAELRNLVEVDMDASTEATTTTGQALADLIERVSNVQAEIREVRRPS